MSIEIIKNDLKIIEVEIEKIESELNKKDIDSSLLVELLEKHNELIDKRNNLLNVGKCECENGGK